MSNGFAPLPKSVEGAQKPINPGNGNYFRGADLFHFLDSEASLHAENTVAKLA